MCERWCYIVMFFYSVGVYSAKTFLFEFHPKPMSSTQGIKSLKALVISIKVNERPLHTHLHTHTINKHTHMASITKLQCLSSLKWEGHIKEKVNTCAQSEENFSPDSTNHSHQVKQMFAEEFLKPNWPFLSKASQTQHTLVFHVFSTTCIVR